MAPRQWALGQTQVDDLLSGGSRYVLSEPGQAWRGANGQMGKLIAGESRRVGPSKNQIGTFGTLVPTIHKPTPILLPAGSSFRGIHVQSLRMFREPECGSRPRSRCGRVCQDSREERGN